MKCNKCGSSLKQETFKFCPYCGADRTVSSEAAAPADQTVVDQAVPLESTADTVDDQHAADDGAAIDDEATMIDTPAFDPDTDAAAHNATTNNLEAVDNPDSDPANKSFSETAWFMTAAVPEALSDGEGEPTDFNEQESMTERYEVEDKLPASVRKAFSLTMNQPAVLIDDEGDEKK